MPEGCSIFCRTKAAGEVPANDLINEAVAAAHRDPCPVLQKIAKIRPEDPDDRLFKVLTSCGKALDVPIDTVKLREDFVYPCLRPRETLDAIARKGCIQRVIGAPLERASETLQAFWAKYKVTHADHELFQVEEGGWGNLIPMYLHGDGGRTVKHESIVCLSMYAALGRGSAKHPVQNMLPASRSRGSKRSREGEDVAADNGGDVGSVDMGLNLLGSSLGTRFLFTAIHNDFVKSSKATWVNLLEAWAQELRSLYLDGFEHNKQVWRVAVLGMTGDAPFLRDAGLMNRSFNNIRKSTKGSTWLPGVCHLCLAGRTGGPCFEDLDISQADWLQTMGPMNDLPWDEPSPLLEGIPMDSKNLPCFFHGDLFHIWYLGMGKEFCASSLVYMLKKKGCLKRKNAELSMANLNNVLKTLQKSGTIESLHCGRLSWDLLDYSGPRKFPKGKWPKGMDTAKVTVLVESLAAEHLGNFPNDGILKLIHMGAEAIGVFLRTLFAAGFFLTSAEAFAAIQAALKFLCCYQKLAKQCYLSKMCYFKLKPKAHAMAHLIQQMVSEYKACEASVCNPVASATFMQEDFVGHIGRLSRRVSPRKQGEKLLHRYLAAIQKALAEDR